MLVKDILAGKAESKIFSVAPNDTVSMAAELLSRNRIGALIVREEGGPLLGILSERDIVREIGKRGVTCMSDSVRDIMTKDVQHCAPGETTKAMMVKMTEGRFRHLPVTEGDTLLGLISIGDVVATRIREIQNENAAMADMIAGNM